MKQKDSFNYSRRSRWLLPLVMLFALLTSANPAWGETLTETFDEVTVTSRYLLSNGWEMKHNGGKYQGFGGDYDMQIKSGNYDGNTGKALYFNYSDDNEYVVIPTTLTGEVSFYAKRTTSSGTKTVTFYSVTKSGDTWVIGSQLFNQSLGSSWTKYSFNLSEPTMVAFKLKYAWFDQFSATVYEEVSGPGFEVKDGDTKLTSPFAYSFGLATAGTTKTFTLSNPGAEATPIAVDVTGANGFTAAVEGNATSIPAGGTKTLTITMPNATADGTIVVTPTGEGLDAFTFNVSGTIRDINKVYETLSTQPTGWTTDGTWYFNSTNGAYTTAWYLSSNARLKSPMLTVAAGEKFIVEAKGTYPTDESYQHLQLEYSADGTTWTAIGEEMSLTSSFKTFTISTPNEFVAGNYYIALHGSMVAIRLFYGGEKVAGANFAINTDGSTQNFGSVRYGTTAQKQYTITNNGDKEMFITITSSSENFTAALAGNVENDNNVYFTKPADWGAPNIYYWNDGGDWPGKAMTKAYTNEYGQDVYYYERPAGAQGIIFNDGISGHQTVDIIGETLNSNAFYISGGQDGSGHYNVATWICKNRVPAGQTNVLTVSMNTATSGDKSGNVELTFDALNATSFTIPCTGNVKDENYLYVDFADGKPEGWTSGDNWEFTSGYAAQISTTTASALITTPLTVAENETMTFKVRRNSTGTKLLKVSYSDNGGVTWTEKYSNADFSSGFTTVELTEIPAGKVILKFYGNNIQLDDIEGFTKTTAPVLSLKENDVTVAKGDSKDFGNLNDNGVATYTLKNTGNADMVSVVSTTGIATAVISGEGEGITLAKVNDSETYNKVTLAAGKSATITLTVPFGAPYGVKGGVMTIDSESWVGDMVVNYTANLIDPTDFVEDFTSGKPEGWYLDTWAVSNGEASIYVGTAKAMITEKIGAEAGKNELSFDTKLKSDSYGTFKLNVYTSTDRKNWGEAKKEVTLTNEVQHITLNALADDEYYVKFEAANAIIDNITGVKKLAAPAHDLYLASATLPTDDITPIDTYTATVKIASLRADEDVTAELYFGETKVSEENLTINNGSTETINISGQAPAAGTYDVYVKVYNANVSVQTENASVTVADKTELSITNFAAVSNAATADENNEFTAEFNVTVKNTGSTSFAANEVSVTVTDFDNNPYQTTTWTPAETIYLKAGNYTADGAKLAIYRWSTNEDQEWAFFTGGTDDIYTASLNGKEKFIIVRLKKSGDDGYDSTNDGLNWNNKHNQSDDLTTATGVVFVNNGYQDGKMKMTQSNNFIAGMSATINVSVTAAAGEGGEFKFNVKEDNADTYWYPTTGSYATVNVTAAPTIALNENSSEAFATGSNRKARLTRTFTSTWNTICLPFAVAAGDIESKFGADALVYAFTAYTDGILKFDEMTGDMAASTPYLIYTPNAPEEPIEFTNVSIASTEPGNVDNNSVTFQGTYSKIEKGEGSALDGAYGISSDNRIAKGDKETSMKGFRAYLTGSINLVNARIAIFDETTGITRIFGADEIFGKDDKVYDLNGRRVEHATQKGVYIVNGRKMVVK